MPTVIMYYPKCSSAGHFEYPTNNTTFFTHKRKSQTHPFDDKYSYKTKRPKKIQGSNMLEAPRSSYQGVEAPTPQHRRAQQPQNTSNEIKLQVHLLGKSILSLQDIHEALNFLIV